MSQLDQRYSQALRVRLWIKTHKELDEMVPSFKDAEELIENRLAHLPSTVLDYEVKVSPRRATGTSG